VKRETPDSFVAWLIGEFDKPGGPDHAEVYSRLQGVELGQTMLAGAVAAHEMYISYREAGFTEAQAMKIVLNAQAAVIAASAAQQAHKEDGRGDQG